MSATIMPTSPLPQPLAALCYANDFDAAQAQSRYLHAGSDYIFVNSFGLRLVNSRLREQALLMDRFPRASRSAYQAYTDLSDCLRQLSLAGYALVRVQPFRFDDNQWLGLTRSGDQVEGNPVRPWYSSPLIPLLRIANLQLHERIRIGLRSLEPLTVPAGGAAPTPAAAA